MILKFEDKIGELDVILSKYKAKWQLTALSWMDYDDVCQIIRLHIFKKWHLWDQERPFGPWASMAVGNQIKNLIRNNYTSFAKPCLRCPFNMGNDLCSKTASGLQDRSCADFEKWSEKKAGAYNIKLPLPIDEATVSGVSHLSDHFDYTKAKDRLHASIIKRLGNGRHAMIYSMMYIEHKTDEEIAKAFKFKKDPSKRKTARYKQISNLRKKFYELAQEVMKEEDIL